MSWYHVAGNQQDTAVCTCVRLSRNLAGYPFPARLDAAGAREIIGKVGAVLEKNGFVSTDFAEISRGAAESLAEKRFVGPRFARESLPHVLYLNDPCNLSVAVCEEDHVRIRCILSGLSLKDAYEGAGKVETLLDHALELAFDEARGYLTACPTNLGTAMRASVMLSLPLLTAAGRMEQLALRLGQTGLLLRGLYGEGSSAAGCLYQISNRATLGLTEEEIIHHLEESARTLMEAERQCREEIVGVELDRLTDRVRRGEGILRHAHMLSAGEMLSLLGQARLGAAMGLLSGVRVEDMTALLVEAMPATLTLGRENPPKSDRERDILRAKLVRERLFG